MNKVKKIFISIGAFFTGLISKVYALDARMVEIKYGIVNPEPTAGERILSIWWKIALPIILFVTGLSVILSKKLTKKVKAIVVSILAILAVLGYVLMNYFQQIFNY